MCYSCSKGLEPVETFITELKEDWSSESPKGFTKKIKRFGKLLTSFIEYDPKLRLELSAFVENDKLLKTESDRLKIEETYKENLLHFIENFNRDKPKNYSVEKLIDDTGSFGNVFVILDPEGNSKSMKIISTMRNDLTQTIREIEILKIMDHSNVIKYYEMFDYSNYVCIVTELCKDGDLQNYLACLKYKARQTLSVAKQIKFCHQLADGLSYIHEKHIIHRDIKPSNLLLINNNQIIKYADFGFSIQNNSADSFCGTYLGTINYAAPEIINGTPYSFKVDIWSLACVFYEIVTLNYAFSYDSNDRPQIFNKQPPKLPANHPLESLLNKMFVENETNRISSKNLLDQLERIKTKNISENFQSEDELIQSTITNENNQSQNRQSPSLYFNDKTHTREQESIEISKSTEIPVANEKTSKANQDVILDLENYHITEMRGYYEASNRSSRSSFVLETRGDSIKMNHEFLNMIFPSK